MIQSSNHEMTAVRSRHFFLSLDFIVCLLLFVVSLAVFRLSDIDMELQRRFYLSDSGWFMGNLPLPYLLYHYSNLPALALALSGILLFALSYQSARYLKWRKIGIFLVLTMIIAPGLIVNSILKEQWGRPRPRNIIEFDGRFAYEPLLTIDPTSTGNSFPSGHASMGFYLFVPWFLLRRRHRRSAYALLALGISAGALIGYVRMIQGGHFASDIVISGLVVYLTAFALYRIMGLHSDIWYHPKPSTKQKRLKPLTKAFLIILGIALTFAVMLATPYQQKQLIQLDSTQTGGTLKLNMLTGDLHISMADSTYLASESRGFGFPRSKLRWRKQSDGTSIGTTELSQHKKGLFTEIGNVSRLALNRSAVVNFTVLTPNSIIDADLSQADSIRNAVLVAQDAQISVTLPEWYDLGVAIQGNPRLINPSGIRIVNQEEEQLAPPVVIKMNTGELTLRRISLDSNPAPDRVSKN